MRNIYYITNMFPSKKDNYGVFCKKTYDFFNNSNEFEISNMSAIYGKSQNKYFNILRYMKLLFSIFCNLIFRIKDFDIVYIQYVWKHAFFVSKFIPLLDKKKKKCFINFHGEDLTGYDNLSKSEKKSFQKLCEFASCIVVPSQYFKNLLLEVIPCKLEDKIFVTPSGGVDSVKFYKNNKLLKNNTIIYCSRFDTDKGWDDFINAAEILINQGFGFRYIMIGYGKQTQLVRDMIASKKLNSSIELIINPNQESIAEKYTESDVFIFPTRLAESLGLVALEAMSCGLAVISSNIGAISEYVQNNLNGYMYEPGNVDELCEKIILFFSKNENERLEMQTNAYSTADKYKDSNVEKEFINRILEF